MNIRDFHADMVRLVTALIPEIADDYRATNDPEDNEPGMCLTVGADADGWSYQTGDNSYTGGAYGYATWAMVYLSRDSKPAEVADEIVAELVENGPDELRPDESPIFEEDSQS